MNSTDVALFAPYTLVERLSSKLSRDVFLAFRPGRNGSRTPAILKSVRVNVTRELQREAQIMASLHHDSICSIFEANIKFEQPFLAMEYIEGIGLADIISLLNKRTPAFALDVGLKIAAQLAGTLVYLQQPRDLASGQHGAIIHGDLSPGNLIVTLSGQLKLIDFGCAQVRNASEPANINLATATVRYASPNRIATQRCEVHDDIFAFGVILWELCTGHRYWDELSSDEIQERLRNFSPRDPLTVKADLPKPIRDIVMACTTDDYFSGYTDANDILRDLETARSKLENQMVVTDLSAFLQSEFVAFNQELMRRKHLLASTPSKNDTSHAEPVKKNALLRMFRKITKAG
ncbi:MAG: serine/threonine protein kinase [Bdellovibrionales bacterium]